MLNAIFSSIHTYSVQLLMMRQPIKYYVMHKLMFMPYKWNG